MISPLASNTATPQAGKRRKVGVDLDGVLAATAEEFLRIMQELHGRRVPMEAIRGYRLEEWTGLSTDQVNHIFQETAIFERAEPVAGAVEGLRTLREAGWEVHIVTFRAWKPELRAVTHEWLARHAMPYDVVELTPTPDKSRYAQAQGLPVFIEDNWNSIEALARTCERVFLVDWPYNQGPLPSNALRVSGWPELLRQFGHGGASPAPPEN